MVDDDIFAAFSDSESEGGGELDDDPFAALDSGMDDDPFAALDDDEDEADLFANFDTAEEAEDPFAGFEEPPPQDAPAEEATAPPDEQPAGEKEGTPAWLSELRGDYEDEKAATVARSEAKKSEAPGMLTRMVGTGPQGMAFGMTAQQRMVLSIFLFLDVAVLGLMILLAIGAINVG